MKPILVLLALALTSCMTVRPINYNGEELFEVNCNGTARTMGDCMSKSSEYCSKLGKKAKSISQDGTSTVVGMNGQILPSVSRSLLFKCE